MVYLISHQKTISKQWYVHPRNNDITKLLQFLEGFAPTKMVCASPATSWNSHPPLFVLHVLPVRCVKQEAGAPSTVGFVGFKQKTREELDHVIHICVKLCKQQS